MEVPCVIERSKYGWLGEPDLLRTKKLSNSFTYL